MHDRHTRKAAMQYSDVELRRALRDGGGYFDAAAELLGCTVATVRRRVNANPANRLYRMKIIGNIAQVAEQNMIDLVLEGDWQASKFAMERLMREKYAPSNSLMLMDGSDTPIGETPVEVEDAG